MDLGEEYKMCYASHRWQVSFSDLPVWKDVIQSLWVRALNVQAGEHGISRDELTMSGGKRAWEYFVKKDWRLVVYLYFSFTESRSKQLSDQLTQGVSRSKT